MLTLTKSPFGGPLGAHDKRIDYSIGVAATSRQRRRFFRLTQVHGFCTPSTWALYSEYMTLVLRVHGSCTVAGIVGCARYMVCACEERRRCGSGSGALPHRRDVLRIGGVGCCGVAGRMGAGGYYSANFQLKPFTLFHAPRVKSGMATGMEPFSMDMRDSSLMQHHSAMS